MQVFIGDAVTSECVVKQRCSAANVILFIENSRRPDVMVKNALTKCLGKLTNNENAAMFKANDSILFLIRYFSERLYFDEYRWCSWFTSAIVAGIAVAEKIASNCYQ